MYLFLQKVILLKMSLSKVFTWIDNENLAIILVLLGTLNFFGGFIFVNEMKIHPITTGISRGVALLFFCYLLSRKFSQELSYKSSYLLKWLIIRGTIMVFQVFALSAFQFYLPQPIAITICSCSVIFTTIIDYFLNGVTLNRPQIIALFISLIGVLLTANGSFLITFFDQNFTYNNSKFKNYNSNDITVIMLASIMMIFVMIVYSYGLVITKKLVGCSSTQINFVMGALSIFFSALLFPLTLGQSSYHTPNFDVFLKSLIFSGVPMAIGTLAFNAALTLTNNIGLMTALSLVSILYGYIISILRYQEPVNPICTIGAVSIVIGIICIVKYKKQITDK